MDEKERQMWLRLDEKIKRDAAKAEPPPADYFDKLVPHAPDGDFTIQGEEPDYPDISAFMDGASPPPRVQPPQVKEFEYRDEEGNPD